PGFGTGPPDLSRDLGLRALSADLSDPNHRYTLGAADARVVPGYRGSGVPHGGGPELGAAPGYPADTHSRRRGARRSGVEKRRRSRFPGSVQLWRETPGIAAAHGVSVHPPADCAFIGPHEMRAFALAAARHRFPRASSYPVSDLERGLAGAHAMAGGGR